MKAAMRTGTDQPAKGDRGTMMTGEQYLDSLRDGRRVALDGVLLPDVTADPGLGNAARWVATGYDRIRSGYPDGVNPIYQIPRTVEDLRARLDLVQESDVTVALTSAVLALLTAAPRLAMANPAYRERILHYFEDCRRRDVRFAEVITDAKGDRSLPPGKQDDPDLYLRVVDRDADGIVINGAKFHITMGPLVHELVVMPTKRMKPGEEQYAVACAVPVNSPGVTQIATSPHPRGSDGRSHPVSGRHTDPDSIVIFDHVHVPYERVFLDGEVEESAVVAHSLGLWERINGVADMARLGDLLVGMAQLVAEANGVDRIPHIKDKIAEMVIYATLVRAGLEASIAGATHTEDGMIAPNELYANAAKYHAAAHYPVMVRNLHDIAGGAVATAPSMADYDNPQLRPYIDKYLRTMPGVDGYYRMRLFHLIRDVTADALGGRELVSWLQSGGGLFAQRTVTRKHYDIEAAKDLARRAGGLLDGAEPASYPDGHG
ncbi:4-hydroxyphenylacetate 3-hydroxylase N-terminal domain-containing protein [Frankia sp. Cas4]|uniref:4-hydroxyphenylacetate 3-hydroxylase N-terminal domain-containing protein n=1 Tax=Frankia sp. Cas4 TaxID=3073927 RepID=UPI002AD42D9F|nr:4-hydroxyphenylacetate 3-hydroxylase N-terminal domain-containing protein [Frankia sp. Cas4]